MPGQLRSVGTGRCEECGTPIVVPKGGRFPKRYCSARCGSHAYNRTHRAELAAKAHARKAARGPSPPRAHDG
jgi:hypothetical protein